MEAHVLHGMNLFHVWKFSGLWIGASRMRPTPQSLLVHQDWQTPATLLMRVSLLLAARELERLRHARTARPGIASKLFVGALMLIGTLSSSVPVIPEHTPVLLRLVQHHCRVQLLSLRMKGLTFLSTLMNCLIRIDWHHFTTDRVL